MRRLLAPLLLIAVVTGSIGEQTLRHAREEKRLSDSRYFELPPMGLEITGWPTSINSEQFRRGRLQGRAAAERDSIPRIIYGEAGIHSSPLGDHPYMPVVDPALALLRHRTGKAVHFESRSADGDEETGYIRGYFEVTLRRLGASRDLVLNTWNEGMGLRSLAVPTPGQPSGRWGPACRGGGYSGDDYACSFDILTADGLGGRLYWLGSEISVDDDGRVSQVHFDGYIEERDDQFQKLRSRPMIAAFTFDRLRDSLMLLRYPPVPPPYRDIGLRSPLRVAVSLSHP